MAKKSNESCTTVLALELLSCEGKAPAHDAYRQDSWKEAFILVQAVVAYQ